MRPLGLRIYEAIFPEDEISNDDPVTVDICLLCRDALIRKNHDK